MNQWLSRAAVAVLILSISAIIFSEQRLKGPVSTPAVTEESLRSARDSRVGWLTHGRDWSNQRYAPFTEINRESVKRLQEVWDHRLVVRSSVRIQSTPLVIDHLLIYTDARDHVIAIDARSGQERWSYQPVLGPTALCCGFVNRGVAIYNDKVFVATLDARIIALDRRDGSVVWDVKAAEPKEGYSFTVAPLAADGKIIVGSSGGEFGIRGFVDAYDPDTGKRIWRFWTIPSPEEGGWYGRWARTAPDGESLHRNIDQEKRDSARYADAWKRGGSPVWSTPAYDPDLGFLLVATGNPSPFEGVTPPGDNLYSTSLIAVDIHTGKMKWYYQMIPHNMWDLDAASPPVLFNAVVGDSVVPAVGQAGKSGWVYIVDRRTGRPIRRSDPFVPMENVFPAPTLKGTRSSPAVRGGSGWPPAAYSPRTGLMYVMGSHIPMLFTLNPAQKAGELYWNPVYKKLPDSLSFGTFSAIDVSTGKIRWQKKVPRHMQWGGVLATEGGLVFYGEAQGWLNAVDAETGETRWRRKLSRAFMGPPISFLVDGRQRIAVTTQEGVTVLGLPDSQPRRDAASRSP